MGGMTRLLLLLWAGVTVGSVVDLQKRIIGGVDCPKPERGYHAYLTFTKVTRTSTLTSTDTSRCGGSLIDKQWILTAAHCWKDGWTVKAVLGPHTDNPTPVEIGPTTRIFPDTDKRSNTKKHDIMLLKLLKPATGIDPVPLPVSIDCANKPTKGEPVQIAGYYSKIQPHDKKVPDQLDYSKPLQCADIKVVNCDEFTTCLEANDPYHYQHLLCYDDEKEKVDTSPGDSGGGVVFNKIIYGVHVSGDIIACGGAAASMDLCKDIYKEWISETIAANSGG